MKTYTLMRNALRLADLYTSVVRETLFRQHFGEPISFFFDPQNDYDCVVVVDGKKNLGNR